MLCFIRDPTYTQAQTKDQQMYNINIHQIQWFISHKKIKDGPLKLLTGGARKEQGKLTLIRRVYKKGNSLLVLFSFAEQTFSHNSDQNPSPISNTAFPEEGFGYLISDGTG